jgi:hypothetical protein
VHCVGAAVRISKQKGNEGLCSLQVALLTSLLGELASVVQQHHSTVSHCWPLWMRTHRVHWDEFAQPGSVEGAGSGISKLLLQVANRCKQCSTQQHGVS